MPTDEGVGMPETGPCAVCARSPLVGEGVAIVSGGGAEAAVCDLCMAKPRALRLGLPVRRERVRSVEGAATVHRTLPVPAHPAVPVHHARVA